MKKTVLISNLIFMLCVLSTNPMNGQSNNPGKKIQSIVNMVRFFDWSQNKSFNHELKRIYVITNKTDTLNYEKNDKGRNILKDWKITSTNKLSCIENGSVVFLTKAMQHRVNEIIQFAQHKDIITVSENIDHFCRQGGMVNLSEKEGQIKFEINYRIIQEKSLDISSKLLALSKIYD
jgi:hypothetical protein